MNQYTVKIWKENPDHVSMIEFEFLNKSSICYYPDRNEWCGIDKYHEPMSLPKVYAIVSRHSLLKEVDAMSLDCTSEINKNTPEELETFDINDRTCYRVRSNNGLL